MSSVKSRTNTSLESKFKFQRFNELRNEVESDILASRNATFWIHFTSVQCASGFKTNGQ